MIRRTLAYLQTLPDLSPLAGLGLILALTLARL
jgi:hypothetical protein